MITFSHYLQESLSQAVPYKWTDIPQLVRNRPELDDYQVYFTIRGPVQLDYIAGFENQHYYWNFAFSLHDESLPPDQGTETENVTGTGHAFAVFATVAEIMKDFCLRMQPKQVRFTAKEPSRIRLYQRFVSMVGQKIPGYTGSSSGNKFSLNRIAA